MQYFKEI